MIASFTVGESYGALAKFATYPKLLVEGPRGTSKSRSILGYFLAKLYEFPGARLLICRRYRAELTKTILTTLEDEVFPDFGIPVPGGAHRSGRSEYLLPNGSVIWPAGVDDGMGALSMGVSFAYCAEVIEMDEETVTDIAGGLRWLKSPERPQLPEHSQLIMDCNPGAPAHWANQLAEPVSDSLRRVSSVDDYMRLQQHNYREAADPVRRWKRILTRHQDNPGYWDHDKWEFTPIGRNYVTQQLEGYRGAKRERWLHGLWKAAEGSVFPEFDVERNVCKPFPNGWPKDWPVWIGYDPGYAHPCAVVFWGVAPSGQPFVIDEIHGSEIDLDRLAPMIRAKADQYRVVRWLDDPRGANQRRQESNGQTVRTIMRDKHRLFFQGWQAAEGAGKQSQVEAVRLLIIDAKKPLVVWDTCPGVIREFQSWAYARTADGSLKSGDDAYEDRSNDAMDAIMGIVAEQPKYEQAAITLMGGRKRVMAADDDED